jgi:hypothetical protein
MTTNLAEVYNWVMKDVRGLLLVGIVEFILQGTCKYFRDRYAVAHTALNDARMIYGTNMSKYMEDKAEKAKMHRLNPMGTTQHRYEILCRDKARRGSKHERVIHECTIFMTKSFTHIDATAACSHVIAGVDAMRTQRFVYDYFKKEALFNT